MATSELLTTITKKGTKYEVRYVEGKNGLFFQGGMNVDADGSPHAYHPTDDSKALDQRANGGVPGDWWGIATTNGKSNGKPFIQQTGQWKGFYVSTTALGDPKIKNNCDPRKYVDAEFVPYIVIPTKLIQTTGKDFQLKLGDLAAVIDRKTGRTTYAIIAETPNICEGSIQLAKNLGLPSNPKGDPGPAPKVFYIAFPQSRFAPAWPVETAKIEAKGAQLFREWGGINLARTLFA